MAKKYLEMSIEKLLEDYPFVESYLEENNLEIEDKNMSLADYFANMTEEDMEEWALDPEGLIIGFESYMEQMIEFLGIKEDDVVKSLTLISGQDKSGEAENFDQFSINAGEIISIVGPTGSGKSRLLADIEWTAQADTPTKRSVLINGQKPDMKWRYSSSNKLVAQLSQNMNFVMDLSVQEFVELHAKSRLVEDVQGMVLKIIQEANKLAGEKFDLSTPVTALSGGQSRALMIADMAILSKSPIVLIDEIENAGIDRKKALSLLVSEDKIVLMATHDPLLALMADRRLVINNGGIKAVIETSESEKQKLKELEERDKEFAEMRRLLRYGERLD
ncbi:MAG: ATP-binding cassette domain-containing protein [Tissierellales bacterium]|jgi:ABC-type lipoprotein export system ATPase subunit|nr:ATP-binding cassette domain-containing protein [Tissierellales bacterium]